MSARALVDVAPQAAANEPAQTTVNDSAGLILAANPKRKGFSVQNTNTRVIFLGFGTNPTGTAYHVALKACGAANDGTGAMYFENAWVGDVYAIASAAGGTCVILETLTGSPDWNLASTLGSQGY